MTLLEVMVALVILGLVVAAYLELFSGALRGAADTRLWSQAVAYASDGVERAKLEPGAPATERLPGGFERRLEKRPWPGGPGLIELQVVVTLPGGGEYALERLVPTP
jgi:prepilin-type N-terminal cleavage/methylation domain-containing protein